MTPPTPVPDLPLPKAARVINIITALTGLVASGLLGLALLLSILALSRLIVPLLIAPFLFVLLYWGGGAYGAAFIRFERFVLRRLLFQTFLMSGLVWLSAIFFQFTHPLPDIYPLWHPIAATILLVFISLTFLSHLLSLAIRLLHPPSQPGST